MLTPRPAAAPRASRTPPWLDADRVAGALVLLKALDVAVRGPGRLPTTLWALVLAALVGGAASLLAADRAPGPLGRSARLRWLVVGVAAAGVVVDLPRELRLQHTVVLLWLAAGAVVARTARERLLLWRVQITALYGASAAAKVNEAYLGGDVMARSVVQEPVWSALLPLPPPTVLVLMGVGLIATEAALAVTPWVPRLRRPGLALAVALHVVALVLVADAPIVKLRLAFFGGLGVLLHATSAGVLRLPTCSRRTEQAVAAAERSRSRPPTGT